MRIAYSVSLVATAILLPSLASAESVVASAGTNDSIAWPVPSKTNRPWTRWWWLGSGVDAPNLERLLTEYRDAGLGGVEICPIYGAKGYENRFIDFLSPKWMDMLSVTTRTAARLNIGVDMTTGTGWPMGGPWIPAEESSETVVVRHYPLGPDGRISDSVNLTLPEPEAQATGSVSANAGGRSGVDGIIKLAPTR